MADATEIEDKPVVETDDVAGDIRAALDTIKGDNEAPVKMTLDRPRDESGKFVEAKVEPKRPVLTLPNKTDAAPASPVAAPVEGAEPATPAPQTAQAPIAWAAPMKEKFAALPPDVQAYITKRETEAHQAITRVDDDVRFGKKVREIASPYKAIIAAEGGDELSMLPLYLNTAYVFRQGSPQQKLQALHSLAQQFNIPLGNPVQQGLPAHNPAIESLQQRLERIEQERQQEIQQGQFQEQAGIKSEVDAFAAEPGHEHFET